MQVGELEQSLADGKHVIRLCEAHPDKNYYCSKTYQEMAWMMSTWPDERYRDGKRAIELAKAACEAEEMEGLEIPRHSGRRLRRRTGDFARVPSIEEQEAIRNCRRT